MSHGDRECYVCGAKNHSPDVVYLPLPDGRCLPVHLVVVRHVADDGSESFDSESTVLGPPQGRRRRLT